VPDLRTAAFRTEPFTITYNGQALTFRHEPASVWLDVQSRASWVYAICQLADVASYERMLDAVSDGVLRTDDMPRIARAALAEAGGRAWWEVERLISVVYGDGDGGRLLGALVLAGVDPTRITLAAFCSAVWARLTQGADTMQTMKLESQLTIPPAEASEEEVTASEEGFGDPVARLRQLPGVSIG
jgi:hypothetical protein